MQFRRLGVPLAISLVAFAASTGTAAAAGPCDVIVQASNAATQAQLAHTTAAYADGQITPEEAAQSEADSQLILQITRDLGECINTGVIPPGYVPIKPPDTTPPVFNTFVVPLVKWRIGDREFKVVWDTAEPTTVKARFYRVDRGVTPKWLAKPAPRATACRKRKRGDRKRDHKPCRLRTPVGTITTLPGVNSFTFDGKVAGRALKPASYVIELVATDAAGNKSQPKTAKLQILPAKR